MGVRWRVRRQSFPIQGRVKTKELGQNRSWDLGLGSLICHFRPRFITRAGMNSLPSLPRLTAEAAAAIWPKLGSNIGTKASNIYLECGIPASPLVVLIAAAMAAGRRNEWRRFEAERGKDNAKMAFLPSLNHGPSRFNNQHPSTWDGCSLHRVTVAGHGHDQ